MKDKLKGQWSQLKGKIQAQWATFTEEDMEYIGGSMSKLLEKLKERYNYSKEQAEAEWEAFYEKAVQQLPTLQQEVSSLGTLIKENVDEFVKNFPWKSMGIAALIGVLIGKRL